LREKVAAQRSDEGSTAVKRLAVTTAPGDVARGEPKVFADGSNGIVALPQAS
jgi:hypothetical protein